MYALYNRYESRKLTEEELKKVDSCDLDPTLMLQVKSETQMLRHLLANIVDWHSYQGVKAMLQKLVITIEKYYGLYQEYLTKVEENKTVNDVFRVMLIKSIKPKKLPLLDSFQLFHVVQACTTQRNQSVYYGLATQQKILVMYMNHFMMIYVKF